MFARTTNMKIACDPEAKAGSHRCRPSTKPSGWGTTLSKTHDMPKKSRATREQPDKLFAILAEHTEFAELMCIYTTHTRARKPSIIPKLVRLSHCNHGINWTRTPWSRLVGGVYSLSLIFSCSTSTRPGDLCVTAQKAPQCAPRALQPHWPPQWWSRVCARSRARYHEGTIEYWGSKVLHLFHAHSYHLEELRESLRSTRMHYTTIYAPRGVKILEDIIDNSTSVLATVFTLPIFVRVMVVNLADIPRCDAFVLFWVHFFETFDCVYFQRSCNVTNLERVNLL